MTKMTTKRTKRPVATLMALIIANVLIPISIITFGIGFFPYKPFIPGLAEFEPLEYGQPPAAPFDKLIFMVVDALRSDFVYAEGSGFEFTQNLIRNGQALPFTANARSPTVTMPKLKSITTGSVPSFVDLILNFDEADSSSSLAAQDTWLAQMKRKNLGKLLLYGDDTWLKLFPDTFDRHDGTSSFFVADFTEVDNNVTRHIPRELRNEDWGLMVLHYLGVDHIGHKSGPRSSNMIPKQKEMDHVVKQIFTAIESEHHLESTLLVLCGDHGMNDAGNHGASSPGETSPALVFISPKLQTITRGTVAPTIPANEFDYYSMVEQSDIAPTLAGLFGFPVSKNNLGAFIPEFLTFWPSPRDRIQILIRNAKQILNIVAIALGPGIFIPNRKPTPCELEPTELNILACEWRTLNVRAESMAALDNIDHDWLVAMSAWIRRAQNLMSSMASNYDMSKLFFGQFIGIVSIAVTILVLVMAHNAKAESMVLLVCIACSYGGMMFASSYVEEEQHFWYWSTTLWLTYTGIKTLRRTRNWTSAFWSLIALAILRITRSWNQTGQKYAGGPDFTKAVLNKFPTALWILIGLTYLVVWLSMLSNMTHMPFVITAPLASLLVAIAFKFKVAFTAEDAPELVIGTIELLNNTFSGHSLVFLARLVFSLLGVMAVFTVCYRRQGHLYSILTARLIHDLFTLLCITQSRATNIPLFLLAYALYKWLDTSRLSPTEITTCSILLQYTYFFAFGGSNAISSVDLSSAYNGVSGFNVIVVGFLTLISNWAGPIFWTLATNVLLINSHDQASTGLFARHVSLLTFFTTVSVAFVMAACTALRVHLFIWTVFSPKYLYCMAWSLGQHLLINLGLGGAMFWVGTTSRTSNTSHDKR